MIPGSAILIRIGRCKVHETFFCRAQRHYKFLLLCEIKETFSCPYKSKLSVSKHNQATYLRDEFSDPPLWSPLSPLSWLEDLLAALLELPLRLSASLGGSLVTWQPVMKLRLWGLNTIPSVSAMKSLSLISFFWKITDKKLGSYLM